MHLNIILLCRSIEYGVYYCTSYWHSFHLSSNSPRNSGCINALFLVKQEKQLQSGLCQLQQPRVQFINNEHISWK